LFAVATLLAIGVPANAEPTIVGGQAATTARTSSSGST
jgi:hypothetical protein